MYPRLFDIPGDNMFTSKRPHDKLNRIKLSTSQQAEAGVAALLDHKTCGRGYLVGLFRRSMFETNRWWSLSSTKKFRCVALASSALIGSVQW
jgi:hypothetical protein